MTAAMTFDFHDTASAFDVGPGTVGGKAFGLARMARYGLPVPAMLAIGPSLYQSVMQDAAVAAARMQAGDRPGEEDLAAIRAAICDHPFTQKFRGQLTEALTRARLDGCTLAVRSSAIGEDGDKASFAGIHESVLQVSGIDETCRAILTVFASAWTMTATSYRLKQGLGLDDAPMALLVCAMVPGKADPRAAGVAFTADPATGARDRYVIEATTGLGDALVRGQVQGHRYDVTFTPDQQPIAPKSQGGPLPPEALMTLTRLLQRAHDSLGDGDDPLDFEWVWDGHGFTLVQVRPITALPFPSFAGLAGQPTLWSNANFKEVLLPIPSPMGWALAKGSIPPLITIMPERAGYPLPPGLCHIRRFKGRPYLNVSFQQWIWHDGFGTPPAEVNRSLGGHQKEITLPEGSVGVGRKFRRILNFIRLGIFLTAKGKALAQRSDALIAYARASRQWDLRAMDEAALHARLLEGIHHFADFFDDFAASSGLCGGGLAMFRNKLAKLPDGEDRDRLEGLLTGGQVDSAEHGRRLRELAQLADSCPVADSILKNGRLPIPPGDSAFERAFSAYLDDFGHRGVGETDISKPRWIEDPGYLLNQIRLLAGSDADETGRNARNAAEATLAGLPRRQRKGLAAAAQKARDGMALREKAKSALVAGLEPARHILLEVARRLVARDILAIPDDIFWLTFTEVDAIRHGDLTGDAAHHLIADRKVRHAAWAAETAPDVFEESLTGTIHLPADRVAKASKNGHWHGMGAYPGQYTGVARVLTGPEQSDRLKAGEILVAATTDPAWTPIFLRAGALIMETGGAVSHGVIVAREYGLPTVVNIPGILTEIRDGETITIDGARGEIRRGSQ